MTLDELFDEYKKKKAQTDELLNQLAEEARRFCMATVYWDRRRSFYKRIPDEDEALSIFHETFMKCVKRGLEGKTETLSGCLSFYFPRALVDDIRQQRRIPMPVTGLANDRGTEPGDLLDSLMARDKGKGWIHPDSAIRAKEIMNRFLAVLESLSRFQRDALILNFSGFSHEDIAFFLASGKNKVSKGKCLARERLRKILHEGE